MANPLQPKVVKCLENDFSAYVINITSASKAGHMDVIACIKGLFYGFEVKWKNDVPSPLQKQKINELSNSGGKGYFIRSIAQLRDILENDRPTERYDLSTKLIL